MSVGAMVSAGLGFPQANSTTRLGSEPSLVFTVFKAFTAFRTPQNWSTAASLDRFQGSTAVLQVRCRSRWHLELGLRLYLNLWRLLTFRLGRRGMLRWNVYRWCLRR